MRTPPRGLGILLLVGPAFVWSAEYIGTGEVLLATRAGAVLGTAILWAVVLGILLKYWIGMAGARYTACTGEGMVDLFARVPGPRNWAVWVPAWATAQGVQTNPWREIMPLLGWGAGGFASQVWYTYWVLGAGYGVAEGRGYGEPADRDALSRMTRATAEKVGGWCRVVYVDATIALVIGVVVTSAFVLSGAGVLRTMQLVPKGDGIRMAGTIAAIFSSQWGALGETLFLVAAIAALVGTLLGQLAGWPRLLADAFRLAIPAVYRRFEWKTQFRFFLLFFFGTNMVIVYVMQKNPIGIVQTAAVLDGILLTALQALWVGLGLYVVLPRLLSKEAWDVLRPSPVFAVGLAAGALVFGWLTVTEAIPQILAALG